MLSLPPCDRDAFLDALQMWDRPDEQLRARPLDADADVDAFVDAAFSTLRGAPGE